MLWRVAWREMFVWAVCFECWSEETNSYLFQAMLPEHDYLVIFHLGSCFTDIEAFHAFDILVQQPVYHIPQISRGRIPCHMIIITLIQGRTTTSPLPIQNYRADTWGQTTTVPPSCCYDQIWSDQYAWLYFLAMLPQASSKLHCT